MNRSVRERAQREEGRTKKQMMEFLAAGDGESLMGDPIEWVHYDSKGKRKTRQIIGARRVERNSSSLDEDRALEFLRELDRDGKLGGRGIEECVKTITVVDEDALVALAFEERITDKQLADLYDDRTTYAFTLVDAEEEDED